MREKNPSAELYVQDNCKSLVRYSELLKLMLVFFSKQQKLCGLAGSWSKASWLLSKVKQTKKILKEWVVLKCKKW